MAIRKGFVVVLLVLVAGGALTLVGDVDEDVSFAAVFELWGDVLRDADQFGLRLTRVSDRQEMEIGEEISRQIMGGQGESSALTAYVSEVGEKLVPHVRRKGIRYTFHVVRSPQVNAFAIPGGHIYVFTGMLEFMESEAELAALLGHEISHVDLRHCVERLQYQARLQKVGIGALGRMADTARRLVGLGYNKYQESEADAQGVRLSVEAGYNPEAAVDLWDRMQQRFGPAGHTPPRTPVGELGKAVGDALGSYLHSYPTSADRRRQLQAFVDENRRHLAGRVLVDEIVQYRQRVQPYLYGSSEVGGATPR